MATSDRLGPEHLGFDQLREVVDSWRAAGGDGASRADLLGPVRDLATGLFDPIADAGSVAIPAVGSGPGGNGPGGGSVPGAAQPPGPAAPPGGSPGPAGPVAPPELAGGARLGTSDEWLDRLGWLLDRISVLHGPYQNWRGAALPPAADLDRLSGIDFAAMEATGRDLADRGAGLAAALEPVITPGGRLGDWVGDAAVSYTSQLSGVRAGAEAVVGDLGMVAAATIDLAEHLHALVRDFALEAHEQVGAAVSGLDAGQLDEVIRFVRTNATWLDTWFPGLAQQLTGLLDEFAVTYEGAVTTLEALAGEAVRGVEASTHAYQDVLQQVRPDPFAGVDTDAVASSVPGDPGAPHPASVETASTTPASTIPAGADSAGADSAGADSGGDRSATNSFATWWEAAGFADSDTGAARAEGAEGPVAANPPPLSGTGSGLDGFPVTGSVASGATGLASTSAPQAPEAGGATLASMGSAPDGDHAAVTPDATELPDGDPASGAASDAASDKGEDAVLGARAGDEPPRVWTVRQEPDGGTPLDRLRAALEGIADRDPGERG